MFVTNHYWGYVDFNEKIHVKRYKNDRAIRNAQDSGTTIGIFDPFEAKDIKEALHMILEKWREERVFMKKGIN
jgi:AmiR/NasT family two-component response regulator